jgi:hypothetical protein
LLFYIEQCFIIDKKDFLVGTVQRIQQKGQTRGHVEYRNPVPFDSRDKDKIRVVVTLFDNIGNDNGDNVGDIAFRNKSVVKLVEARHILCSATLTFNTDTGIYYMCKEDYQCVSNQVASCFVRKIHLAKLGNLHKDAMQWKMMVHVL